MADTEITDDFYKVHTKGLGARRKLYQGYVMRFGTKARTALEDVIVTTATHDIELKSDCVQIPRGPLAHSPDDPTQLQIRVDAVVAGVARAEQLGDNVRVVLVVANPELAQALEQTLSSAHTVVHRLPFTKSQICDVLDTALHTPGSADVVPPSAGPPQPLPFGPLPETPATAWVSWDACVLPFRPAVLSVAVPPVRVKILRTVASESRGTGENGALRLASLQSARREGYPVLVDLDLDPSGETGEHMGGDRLILDEYRQWCNSRAAPTFLVSADVMFVYRSMLLQGASSRGGVLWTRQHGKGWGIFDHIPRENDGKELRVAVQMLCEGYFEFEVPK